MQHYYQSLLIAALSLGLNACGGSNSNTYNSDDSHNSDNVTESQVSIGFSDYPVEDAAKVVLTVDSIEFRRTGEETITVDTFSSQDLGITDADTFTIDLLEVQGNDFHLVLDSVILPVGEYEDLRIEVLDENTELSYVEEIEEAAIKELKVPSNEIKLGSFTVDELSTQTFVVEFDLNQAMTYNPGPDRYILKPRGVRVVSLVSAATLIGQADTMALSIDSACAENTDINTGNAVYLYAGHNLDSSTLVDALDPETAESVPEGSILPYAVGMVSEQGEYLISFIEPGDYTLAYSCLASTDSPDTYDAILIPSPETEIVELSFSNGDDAYCGFPLVEGACAQQ